MKVAYIFQEPTGWYICDATAEMLDARGKVHSTKRAAIAWLLEVGYQSGYTHYRTGNTKPRKIPSNTNTGDGPESMKMLFRF